MAFVEVTAALVASAVRATDWHAVDAQTDQDIARNVSGDPDAAPILTDGETAAAIARPRLRAPQPLRAGSSCAGSSCAGSSCAGSSCAGSAPLFQLVDHALSIMPGKGGAAMAETAIKRFRANPGDPFANGNCALTADKSGRLVGTTRGVEANASNAVFTLSPGGGGWIVAVPYSFGVRANGDAAQPAAAVFGLGKGFYAGTTPVGGVNDKGARYRVKPSSGWQARPGSSHLNRKGFLLGFFKKDGFFYDLALDSDASVPSGACATLARQSAIMSASVSRQANCGVHPSNAAARRASPRA